MIINWNIPKKTEELPLVPLSALTKIGDALTEATDGKIQYEIKREQSTTTGNVSHKFYILVPEPQEFKLLAIQTDANLTGYPVKVFNILSGTTSALDAMLGKKFLTAANPDELSGILEKIVESDNANLVIGSLLAEINAQSNLNTDRFGQMRPR